MNKKILILLTLILIGCKNEVSYEIEIINAHEHVQNFKMHNKILAVMNKLNISKMVLLGSPKATIYGGSGFEGYDENNKEILKFVHTYPKRFIALCTINPRDKDKLKKLKNCIDNGATGLKLYSGHSLFYDLPLNTTVMDEIYEYCEINSIPILFHVNAGKYKQEFESVLKKYPRLKINCPHFCLSSINISRLKYLLNTYPNLYTDISFGAFVKPGLRRISKNVSKFKDFMEQYQDRVMFGTDMVITSNKRKTEEWLYNLTKCYMDMLEKQSYDCVVNPDLNEKNLNGLGLNKEILRKVYELNAKRFYNLS